MRALATAFNVDREALEVQFSNTYEIAQAILPECRNNEKEAWRTAISRCENSRSKVKYPVDALKA
eukprot:1770955-Pyramimonas_sp.AAC.1